MTASAVLAPQSTTTSSAQSPYEAAQEVQYLYLSAEIDVLLRQLQSLQVPQTCL